MGRRFIKLYEQIAEWEWFRNPFTLSLFIYLLVKANYKDVEYHGKTIRRGQVLTSLPKIATDTGLSIQQARTALKHLISTGEVTDESNCQYRMITVVKYDDYQSSTDKATDDQQTTNRRPNRRSTDDLTPSIEYIEQKERIEKKNSIEQSPPAEKTDTDYGFDFFWGVYPNKVAKQDALKAWKKLKPSYELTGVILTSLERWKRSDQWTRDGGRYIPHPATWINGRRWEDDIGSLQPPYPVRDQKPPVKKNSFDNFEQRDYSDIPDEDMRRLAEEMRRFKETGEVDA